MKILKLSNRSSRSIKKNQFIVNFKLFIPVNMLNFSFDFMFNCLNVEVRPLFFYLTKQILCFLYQFIRLMVERFHFRYLIGTSDLFSRKYLNNEWHNESYDVYNSTNYLICRHQQCTHIYINSVWYLPSV